MKGNPGKCASFYSFSLATVTLVLMRRRKGQGLRVDFQLSLRERDPGFASSRVSSLGQCPFYPQKADVAGRQLDVRAF
jgi:hypothetical protein